MLAGLMIQIAMKIRLHRLTRDISKLKQEMLKEEIIDRIPTWAVSHGVAQR